MAQTGQNAKDGTKNVEIKCSANYFLFGRTVPANKFLFAGSVPANNFSFAGSVPANNYLFARTVPANKKLPGLSRHVKNYVARLFRQLKTIWRNI